VSPHPPKALIIEDEKAIRRFLRSALEAEGFSVAEAGTAREGLANAAQLKPDLVVLDLGLPDGEGLDLIAPLKFHGAPAIVVLSARDEEAAKVAALDGGADDFVSKPFGVAEFMARARAALRHRVQTEGGQAVYDDGRLHVDLVRHIVRVGGADPKLTPREYDLLAELVTHAGKVLTHRHLLRKVWGSELEADIQALRVHIRNLRQKIEAAPEKPAKIVTESGVGYRLVDGA
jgi:two-component system, OmpR family, KDP operon response regulator KdpE